jgi:hypothetical protein
VVVFLDDTSFAYLFHIAVKCSDVLKEHITSIFGVTELLQVGADMMQ